MTLRAVLGTAAKALALALFAFALFGPLANLALWSVAERWYTPFKLPVTYGLRYWEVVFRPTGDAMSSLATSVSESRRFPEAGRGRPPRSALARPGGSAKGCTLKFSGTAA